jgi:hypothetical protein
MCCMIFLLFFFRNVVHVTCSLSLPETAGDYCRTVCIESGSPVTSSSASGRPPPQFSPAPRSASPSRLSRRCRASPYLRRSPLSRPTVATGSHISPSLHRARVDCPANSPSGGSRHPLPLPAPAFHPTLRCVSPRPPPIPSPKPYCI